MLLIAKHWLNMILGLQVKNVNEQNTAHYV